MSVPAYVSAVKVPEEVVRGRGYGGHNAEGTWLSSFIPFSFLYFPFSDTSSLLPLSSLSPSSLLPLSSLSPSSSNGSQQTSQGRLKLQVKTSSLGANEKPKDG